MKRIFISSNFEQLYNVIFERREVNNIPLIQAQEILSWDEVLHCFCNKNKQSNLHLVNDSLDSLDMEINKNDDFLLWHSKTKDTITQIFNSALIIKGMHTSNPKDFYKPVFDIIQGHHDINKAESIIRELFPNLEKEKDLELKLNLLHSCLTPNGLKKISWENNGTIKIELDGQDKEKHVITDRLENLEALNLFIELKKINGGPFSAEYLQILSILRNKLLKDY